MQKTDDGTVNVMRGTSLSPDQVAEAGLEEIAVRTIDVTASYPGIDEFCNAQTPSYSPTSKMIDGMTESDRARLKEIVRVNVLGPNNGPIEYLARANAIKGRKL